MNDFNKIITKSIAVSFFIIYTEVYILFHSVIFPIYFFKFVVLVILDLDKTMVYKYM